MINSGLVVRSSLAIAAVLAVWRAVNSLEKTAYSIHNPQYTKIFIRLVRVVNKESSLFFIGLLFG